jgi:hypothetical protein
MQTIRKMTTVLLSALLLAACHSPEPINALATDNPDYSIINGDTVKTKVNLDSKLKGKFYHDAHLIAIADTIVTYHEPKLNAAPSKDPDLTSIKNNVHVDLKGKPLQMIAIGGSMTAGVRDGGYFNEGILTSYPNLIARQMKVKKFELPLFDIQEYSGTIRKTKATWNPTGGPVQKYFNVKNNSGAASTENAVTTKKYIGEADNLAVPYFSRSALRGIVNFPNSEQISLMVRVAVDTKNTDLVAKIASKKFDFFILQSGFDDAFGDMSKLSSYPEDYTFKDDLTIEEQNRMAPELALIRSVMLPLNAKGVILNVPDILDLPYFIKTEVVKNYTLKDTYLKDDYGNYRFSFDDIAVFMPSGKIDSLMSPKVSGILKPKTISLTRKDFLNISYDLARIQTGTKTLNGQFQSYSKRYGYPIVDIQSLYKKVANGEFMTDDGVLANVENFYSIDRINPSAFGQAVIANEVIKVMNASYKMGITLIPTKEYLNIK